MNLQFAELRPRGLEGIGIIPTFLDDEDPRSAKDQIHANYQHGGGWNAFPGYSLNRETMSLTYPDDPSIYPLAMAQLRDEMIFIYPFAWVLILQPNGDYEVARID